MTTLLAHPLPPMTGQHRLLDSFEDATYPFDHGLEAFLWHRDTMASPQQNPGRAPCNAAHGELTRIANNAICTWNGAGWWITWIGETAIKAEERGYPLTAFVRIERDALDSGIPAVDFPGEA